MEMSFFRHGFTNWLEMASEMQGTRVSCAAPGCSRVSRVITRMGREPQINTKAKQLISYHFVLGRLENTKLHLVGSHATRKVTSHEHKATDCFLGRTVNV